MKNLIKNKKGFTLIELLAVIVILSILILLAMPSVLRIMENARKNAWNAEVKSYLKAAQTAFTENLMDHPGATKVYFKWNKSGATPLSSPSTSGTQLNLDVDGGNADAYVILIQKTVDTTTNKEKIEYTFHLKNSSYGAISTTGTSCSKTNNTPSAVTDYSKICVYESK